VADSLELAPDILSSCNSTTDASSRIDRRGGDINSVANTTVSPEVDEFTLNPWPSAKAPTFNVLANEVISETWECSILH